MTKAQSPTEERWVGYKLLLGLLVKIHGSDGFSGNTASERTSGFYGPFGRVDRESPYSLYVASIQ